MTIFRVNHNKNYTTINNTICGDARISFKAKGIWLYAFSRPDDWTFHLSDLVKKSTDRHDSINSGLKELENFGYLHRSRIRDEKGKLREAEWDFFETPNNIIKEKLPKVDFPDQDKSSQEKERLPSTESKLSTEKNHQPNLPPKVKPDKPKRKLVDGGFLSEMDKEFGKETVRLALDDFTIACNKETKISDPQAYFRKICERLHYAIDDMPKQKCTSQEEKNNYLKACIYEHNFYKKGGCPHYSVTHLTNYIEFQGPQGKIENIPYKLQEKEFITRCEHWVNKLKLDNEKK